MFSSRFRSFDFFFLTGQCITFGSNECYELGHPGNQPLPLKKLDRKAIAVSCGDKFTVILVNSGEIYSCGVGASVGHPHGNNVLQAERIEGLVGEHITTIAAGSCHTLVLSIDGKCFAWGRGVQGALGLGESGLQHVQTPQQVPLSFASIHGAPVGIAAGYDHSVLWTVDGTIFHHLQTFHSVI